MKRIHVLLLIFLSVTLSSISTLQQEVGRYKYDLKWFDQDSEIRLKIESDNDKYYKALGDRIYVYKVVVQERRSGGRWKNLKLCKNNKPYAFSSSCRNEIKMQTLKLVSEEQLDYEELETPVKATGKLKVSLSDFLREYIIRHLTPLDVFEKRYEEKGVLTTHYCLFYEERVADKYLSLIGVKLQEPRESAQLSQSPQPRTYNIRFDLSGQVQSLLELKNRGDSWYDIRLNGLTFRNKKSIDNNYVTFSHDFKYNPGEKLEIELIGKGFRQLRKNWTLEIPFEEWSKLNKGGLVTIDRRYLSKLIRKKYSFYVVDGPEELKSQRSNIQVNDAGPNTGQIRKLKNNKLTYLTESYDPGKRDLRISNNGKTYSFPYKKWQTWINGEYIKIPWADLDKSGLFHQDYSFELDSFLKEELNRGSINFTGIKVVAEKQLSRALDLNHRGDRTKVTLSLPLRDKYMLRFPGNEFFNGKEADITRQLFSLGRRVSISMNFLQEKEVLNDYQQIQYQSTDNEVLPEDWPRLIFNRDRYGKYQSVDQFIKDQLDDHIYHYEVIGDKIKVSRETLKVPMDYFCALELDDWVSSIAVRDDTFQSISGATGYSLKVVPGMPNSLEIKMTGKDKIRVDFRLKPKKRGLLYPDEIVNDREGEYLSLSWDVRANTLSPIPCPEALLPVELVFFDAIKGRDVALFKRKIAELKQDKYDGKISEFCLVFGYAHDKIIVLHSEEVDFEELLNDQYGNGDQQVHLLRNYNYLPIPFETIMNYLDQQENRSGYRDFIVHKTAYFSPITRMNMTGNDSEMLTAAEVEVKFFQNK